VTTLVPKEVRMVHRAITATVVGIGVLSGCAAASSTAAGRAPEPACSFRSVTTCWTLAGRFPIRQAPAPAPQELRSPPQAVLASAADSIGRR
jgi:hypothetical protein